MGMSTARRKAKRIDHSGSAYFVASENRWRAQFRDASGTLRHLSAKTEQEVIARLDRAIGERDKGVLGLAPTQIPTLGEYLDSWLLGKYDLKPKTVLRYRVAIDRSITPHLGQVRLDQLRAPMFEALYGRLLHDNGLAASTVKHVHATLASALHQAFNHGILPTPLMNKVKAPKVPEVSREIIDAATIKRLLGEAKDRGTRVYVRWRLAILWALRQGEALGLRWGDIDLDTGVIHIRQQMQYFSGEGMKAGPPKADSSVRRFNADAQTLAALRTLRREQVEQKIAASQWEDHDLVFCTDTGRPIDSANDRRQFKRLLKACAGADFRVHDARHTAITNMVMDAIPVPTIQRIAGHSDFRTTMTYVHLTDEAYEAAATSVGRRSG